MALSPGTRLGIYEVTAKIGEGGMGEVYQARDTTLDRDVALKVLPEAFTADPDRLARFQREAKVLASLNHPNIGAIHGLESSGDTQALVLELIEGPTLADRIAEGPIPVDEALTIVKQIADALEVAHDQGIVHRDLKPANVKVRSDGTVKVLDFGLAKAVTPEVGGTSGSDAATMSLSAATQVGMVVGTAAYMSPEQAKGKVVDKRTDIWAFGAVLYEMLTGTRAFPGDDVSDTFASVLAREPAFDALPVSVSAGVRRLLTRCLEKDQQKRLRDLTEGFVQMEDVAARAAVGTAQAPLARELQFWQRPMSAAAVFLFAVVATGVLVLTLTRPEDPTVARLTVLPDDSTAFFQGVVSPDVAISPTGAHIAYLTGSIGLGAQRLHLRPIDQLISETLVEEGELNSPFFSADSQFLGFYDRSTVPPILKRVSVRGGPTSSICELAGDLRGASWGTDGTIVFGSADVASGLWRVSAVGGEPEQLTTPDDEKGEVDHIWPEYLPGNEAVLFTIPAGNVDDSEIAVLSLETGQQKTLIKGGFYPRYSPTGHLIYAVRGNLWAVSFDPKALELTGDPFPIQEEIITKGQGSANFALSDNGSLIYMPGTPTGSSVERTLVWVDRQGTEEEVGAPFAIYESPRISPDGRYVAVEIRGENSDVVVYDLQRETSTRLTFDPANDGVPVWSPDGQEILFSSNRNQHDSVYSKSADGTGQVTLVAKGDNPQVPYFVTPDGESLGLGVNLGSHSDINTVLLRADPATQQGEILLGSGFGERSASVSPDGRWLAYQSNESGVFEVYVRPFPDVNDGRWQISREGGMSPLWDPRGGALLFRKPVTLEMMTVSFESDPTFVPGNPEGLFEARYLFWTPTRRRPFDISPDGERFLMIREGQLASESTAGSQIVVVLNWFEELNNRAPVF